MAADGLLTQTAPGVKTTTFSTAGIGMPKTPSGKILYMRALWSAAANASGANSWVLSCDFSTDNGGTWNELSGSSPIVLNTVPQSGETFLPLAITNTNLLTSTGVLVRLTGTVSGAGSTPTITVTNVDVTYSR
jgi:hypothetical protein